MPLVRPYLLRSEEKYTALCDEAVHLYAEIVRRQPWSLYIRALNSNIKALKRAGDRIKPILRVLTAVLDAFHFDVEANERQLETVTTVIIPQLRECLQPSVRLACAFLFAIAPLLPLFRTNFLRTNERKKATNSSSTMRK